MFLRTWYQMSGTSDADVEPLRLTKIVVRPGRGVAAQEIEPARLLQLALDPLGDLLQRVVERRAGPRRLHDHGPEGEGADPRRGRGRRTRRRRRASTTIIRKTMKERCFSAQSERLSALTKPLPEGGPSGPDGGPARPRSRRSRRGSSPRETTTVAGSKRWTSTLCSATVMFAGSTSHTAGWPLMRVSALAGIAMPVRPFELHAPLHRRAEAHRRRRIDQADAHPERAGDRVGLRIDLCAPVPWR